MKWFSCKDGYGVCGYTHIEVFKRRAGFDYRQTALDYL